MLNKTGAIVPGQRGGAVKCHCDSCGAEFLVRAAEFARRSPTKFCSRACYDTARKAKVIIRACAHCGAEFDAGDRPIGKFCGRICKAESQRKQRTERDIAQRTLEVRIATLMGYSLRGKKAGCKWEKLVGYTLSELIRHLESKFQPGMGWHNIGEWHIDHVRPRSTFSYSSPDDPQFLRCWSLENLQPLWAIDNLRKGSRYTSVCEPVQAPAAS